MNVFTQGIFFKTINLIGSTRVILTNRINPVNVQATATLKKETREKLKAVPEKPKRPPSSYARFVKENHQLIAKNFPSLKGSEILKKVSEEWKNLDEEKKQRYIEEFQKEAVSYHEKIAKYQNQLSNEQKAILNEVSQEKKKSKEKRALKKLCRETGKPKMPVPPFFRFLMEQRKDNNKSVVELSAEIKSTWQAMSSEEKQKYEIQYQREKEQYMKDLEKWEQQMIKNGHYDIVREKTLKNAVSGKAFEEIKNNKSQ